MWFCFCQEIVADKITARYLGRTAIVIASVNDAIQSRRRSTSWIATSP
jgi:hypothetical protein